MTRKTTGKRNPRQRAVHRDPQRVRILLAEDDADYREALQEMYERVFGKGRVDITPVAGGRDAIRILRTPGKRFDILSLDIILSEGNPREGSDGRDVLVEAARSKRCASLIVITGAYQDQEFAIISKISRRKPIQGTIKELAQKFFPGRQLVLHKEKEYDVRNNIGIFEEEFRQCNLLALRGRMLMPPYRLDITGDWVSCKVIVIGQDKRIVIRKEEDARFLFELDRKHKEREPVDFSEVCKILAPRRYAELTSQYSQLAEVARKTTDLQEREEIIEKAKDRAKQLFYKKAHMCVNAFRKRLRNYKIAVDPDCLVSVAGDKRGFRLADGLLETIGAKSMTSGGLAFNDEYNRDAGTHRSSGGNTDDEDD